MVSGQGEARSRRRQLRAFRYSGQRPRRADSDGRRDASSPEGEAPSNQLRSVGGVLRKAGVAGGGEAHQLGQLLVEALATDPVLDGRPAPEVSGGALHFSIAPGAEVHLTGDVDFRPCWWHPPRISAAFGEDFGKPYSKTQVFTPWGHEMGGAKSTRWGDHHPKPLVDANGAKSMRSAQRTASMSSS